VASFSFGGRPFLCGAFPFRGGESPLSLDYRRPTLDQTSIIKEGERTPTLILGRGGSSFIYEGEVSFFPIGKIRGGYGKKSRPRTGRRALFVSTLLLWFRHGQGRRILLG